MAKDKDKDLELRFLETTETEGFSNDVSSLTSQLQKNRKKARQEEDIIKSISSIAKQQEKTQRLIQQREIGYTKGIVEVERSANKLLQKLGLTVDTMTRSARKILITTAQTTKDIVSNMGRTLNQDFQVNRANTVGMALAATTPIFGYFAAKFMETSVFQDFKEKIKDKLGEVFTFVGDKFKKAVGNLKGKKLSDFITMASQGLIYFLKLPFKLIGSTFRVLWESTKFLLKLPFKAIGLAFAGIIKMSKFILTLPFKTIGLAFKAILLPFKIIKGIFGAIRSGYRFDYGQKGGKNVNVIPTAQSGGYVKKGGMVNVHPAEVITPVGKLFKGIEKGFAKALESKPILAITEEISKLRVSLTGVQNEFITGIMETLVRGKFTKKILKIYNIFEGFSGIIKFFTKPRGKYTRELPKFSSPLQNMQTIMGMFYANGMSKLDQLIRILGGNPTDDSTGAGNYLNDGIGIWGLLRKNKDEIFEAKEKGEDVFSSGIFKNAGLIKKVQDGLFSFFGNSFYKSWKKAMKIEAEKTEESNEGITNLVKAAEETKEAREKEEKKKKGLWGWAKYVLMWAFGAVKNLGFGLLKGIGTSILLLGQGISWIMKSGGLKAIGQAVKVAIPLIGTFFNVLIKFLSFSMKVLGPIAGLIVGGGMTLTDAIRGRWNAKETFGKKPGEKLTTSEKLFAWVGGALGGTSGGAKGAKWGAVKGAAMGAVVGSIIPGIGTAIGGAIGAIAGGIIGAIGGKSITLGLSFLWNELKFGIEAVWMFIKWPFNILFETVDKAKDWIGKQLSKFKDWVMNHPIVKSITGWVETEVMPFIKKYVNPVFSFIKQIWGFVTFPFRTIAKILGVAKDFLADPAAREKAMREALEAQKKRHAEARAGIKEITSRAPTAKEIAASQSKISAIPLMDNGGFVGGSHKAIIAHKDEYVVDPVLSRSLRSASKAGIDPKKIIKRGLSGGVSDQIFSEAMDRFDKKFTEISGSISGSIIKGFQMIIDAFTKSEVEQKLGIGGFGRIFGNVPSFAGNIAQRAVKTMATKGKELAIGAKNIGAGIGRGLTSMAKGAAAFLGFKLADRNVDLANVNPLILDPLRGAVSEYKQKTGKDAIITSGFRSAQKQAQMNASGNRYLMAKPGMSMHQYGWAVDINSADANAMAKMGILDKYGLVQPYPIKDPVHIELAQFNSPQARSKLRSQGIPGMSSQIGDPVPGAYLNKKDIATANILMERRRAEAIAGAVNEGMSGTNTEIGKTLQEISNQSNRSMQILTIMSNNLSTMSSNNITPRGSSSILEESLLRGDFPA